MNSQHNNENQAVIDLMRVSEGSLLLNAENVEEHPVIALHDSMRLHDLSSYLGNPKHIECDLRFETLDSLVAYVERYVDDRSVAFIKVNNHFGSSYAPCVMVALDYHLPALPQWVKHKATYPATDNDDARMWVVNDNVWLSQADLVDLFEEFGHVASSPSPAELMTLAQQFQVNRKVTVKGNVSQTSDAITYTYEEEDSAKGGTIKFPARLKLNMRLFEESRTYEVEARFRYRLNNDKTISFKYKILRLDELVRNSVNDFANTVRDSAIGTMCPVYVVA